MKKILFLSAFIFVLAIGLSGCANVEEAVAEMNGQILSKANSFSETSSGQERTEDAARYEKEDLLPVVTELISKGEEVYDLFFEGNLPVEEDQKKEGSSFCPVMSDQFRSIDDLKTFTESVFTKSFAAGTFYSSCIEGDYPVYKMIDGRLCRNIDVSGLNRQIQWLSDTMEIITQAENTIKISMDVALSTGKTLEKELTLVKENGEWRLDSSLIQQ